MTEVLEVYLDGGIIVARGVLTSKQITTLREEAIQIQADSRQFAINYRTQQGKDSIQPVHQADRFLPALRGSGHLAIAGLLAARFNDDTAVATINHQPPGAFQRFHTDEDLVPASIVHLSDDGMLDFVPDASEYRLGPDIFQAYQYCSISVNAGDIVELHLPGLIHRGRNLSSLDRFNIGLYNSGAIDEAILA